MKRVIISFLALTTILLTHQLVLADDIFMAVGGRTVGTKITSLPYSINQPGFYYLKGNLNYNGHDNGITIWAGGVTLDLMGFGITGPGPSQTTSGWGIYIGSKDVEVRNGNVTGFYKGIVTGMESNGLKLTNLKVRDCTAGLWVIADGLIITGCEASDNNVGIVGGGQGGVIDRNIASNNIAEGFALYQFNGIVINNAAYLNTTGFALSNNPGTLVDGNSAYDNYPNWSGLDGCTKGLNTP
jgi:hypothetical protein